MTDWLERAQREIPNSLSQPTAKTAKTGVSSVLAVPHLEKSGISGGGFVSFGSTPTEGFPGIDGDIQPRREIQETSSQLAAVAAETPLPPLSDAAASRRQKVLARNGRQYAVLVEDPSTDPVIMALATPDGTCELNISRDQYDPFDLVALVDRWNSEPDPLWWRVRIQEPGGKVFEVDARAA